jgi:hypothetical protein
MTRTYLCILVCFTCFPWAAHRADSQPADPEEQDWRADMARVDAVRKALRPGPGNDIQAYQRFIKDLQGKWHQRPNKEHYARLMRELCVPLNAGPFQRDGGFALARTYALDALEFRDSIPLNLEMELTQEVVTLTGNMPGAVKGPKFAEQRRKDVEVRLHAWKRLTDAIDPAWNPNEELMSDNGVGARVGVSDGGMDPAGVQDPVLRAKYEAALRANRQKNEKWSQQYALRGRLKWYPSHVERYIIELYAQPPFDSPELEQALKKYIADEKTRSRILKAVKEKSGPLAAGPTGVPPAASHPAR